MTIGAGHALTRMASRRTPPGACQQGVDLAAAAKAPVLSSPEVLAYFSDASTIDGFELWSPLVPAQFCLNSGPSATWLSWVGGTDRVRVGGSDRHLAVRGALPAYRARARGQRAQAPLTRPSTLPPIEPGAPIDPTRRPGVDPNSRPVTTLHPQSPAIPQM